MVISTHNNAIGLIWSLAKSDPVPSKPQCSRSMAAAAFREQQWWRTLFGRRFSSQPAVGPHTTRPVWHTGTTTGSQMEAQGGKVGSEAHLYLGPVSKELLPPFLGPLLWLLPFGRSSLRCSTVEEKGKIVSQVSLLQRNLTCRQRRRSKQHSRSFYKLHEQYSSPAGR